MVFGPRQVVARINQDQVISPQITLWNQQGSQVIQGTLLVIPIEESLLYMRPCICADGRPDSRAEARGRGLPERIVMEETLEAGLDRLFGAGATEGLRVQTDVPGPGQKAPKGPVPTVPATTSPELAELAAEARSALDRAIQAQREGNWAVYGDGIKALGEICSA